MGDLTTSKNQVNLAAQGALSSTKNLLLLGKKLVQSMGATMPDREDKA